MPRIHESKFYCELKVKLLIGGIEFIVFNLSRSLSLSPVVCALWRVYKVAADMNFIRLCLLLFGLSIRLCLSSSDEYVELDDDLDWDGGVDTTDDELYANATETDLPENEFTTNATPPLIENAIKKATTTDDDAIAAESKVHELSAVLKSTIHRIRQQYKKMDIVFLIDSSSSVGKSNFRSELKFVTKFLSDFNVSFNYTRVSIVTFSSQEKIVRNYYYFECNGIHCSAYKIGLMNFEFCLRCRCDEWIIYRCPISTTTNANCSTFKCQQLNSLEAELTQLML